MDVRAIAEAKHHRVLHSSEHILKQALQGPAEVRQISQQILKCSCFHFWSHWKGAFPAFVKPQMSSF